MYNDLLFGAAFVGALVVAWAARMPLPVCPDVSSTIVDPLFTTNEKPQLFYNWPDVYARTLELPFFTPGKWMHGTIAGVAGGALGPECFSAALMLEIGNTAPRSGVLQRSGTPHQPFPES